MMLRTFVLAAALLVLTVAVIATALQPASWPMLLMAGLIVLGTWFERRRYGTAQTEAPSGADWRRTGETFVDDASKRPLTVWYNARTGERRYVEERG